MKIEPFTFPEDVADDAVHTIGVASALGALESGSCDGPISLQLGGFDAVLRDRAIDAAGLATLTAHPARAATAFSTARSMFSTTKSK